MNPKSDQNFVDRLNQHPRLRERMEALLNVVENVAGDCTRADEAEQFVIDELRKMGSDALHCWGDQAAVNSTEQLKEKQTKRFRVTVKKSVLAFHLRGNRGY